jgi:diguanylate cyclase (GGDEF)-like protein
LRQPLGDLNGEVHVFAQGQDDAIWVGTTGGLFRVAPTSNQLRMVMSPVDEGLASSIVIGLLFDAKGTLWVDTGVTGLHRMKSWDGTLAQFDRVSVRHGILGKPFGANLQADGLGRIWTQMGVYDPKLDKLIALTAVDGADIGTGWFNSYATTQDGRMLFGGSKGLMVVSPEQYVEAAFSAPVVVTDLRINGERKDYGGAYPEVVLAPEDRSFSVEFAALDFVEPTSLRYSYRLKGYDDDWVSTGANFRFASYSNLSPGSYTLQVRAANRSGTWGTHELVVPVRKIAAWWQTTWFVFLCIALGVVLFISLVRLRTHQLRVRQGELEAKVHERTTELESLNLELQLQTDALAESSLVDPLTGLHNRRFFAQQIDGDLSLAQRSLEEKSQLVPGADWTGDLVFFLFDIDHFKTVNDSYGHAVGDEVLIQVSQRIRSVFRDSDYLVRWGGEEFLGVARQTSRAKAGELAERARIAIADTAFETISGLRLQVTVSVGYAAYPLSMQEPRALGWEDLVKLADSALYLVKANGRNGWVGVKDCSDMPADDIRGILKRPLVEVMQHGLIGFECSASVLSGLNT